MTNAALFRKAGVGKRCHVGAASAVIAINAKTLASQKVQRVFL